MKLAIFRARVEVDPALKLKNKQKTPLQNLSNFNSMKNIEFCPSNEKVTFEELHSTFRSNRQKTWKPLDNFRKLAIFRARARVDPAPKSKNEQKTHLQNSSNFNSMKK